MSVREESFEALTCHRPSEREGAPFAARRAEWTRRVLAGALVLGALSAGCASGGIESDESDESNEEEVGEAEQALSALPRIRSIDYSGPAPGQVRYDEGWGESNALNGWVDSNDWQLVGDFMGIGYSQTMHLNRTFGGGRVMILDYSAGTVPGYVPHWESWGDSPQLDGWDGDEDRQLAGDFMGLGHDQVLHLNRDGLGGRVMIVDYASGAVPGQVRYWESYGESPQLNGWTDDEDRQLAGDFMGLGHDQVLYFNRDGLGGRVMIVDYASGTVPGQVRYWESWGESPQLNGWMDDEDHHLVGDFMGLGHDQVLHLNRDGLGGRVMIVDYSSGTVPGQVRYWESWGENPLLNGWEEDEDPQLVGDFRGLGHDQVMYVNRDGLGGKLMVVDYSSGVVPGQVLTGEIWGDFSLHDDLLDRGDRSLVGDFAHVGHDQIQWMNLSSDRLVAQRFAPRLRFDSDIHGYPMSAQSFYDQAVAVPQTYRVENLDYATIESNSVPIYYQIARCGDQRRITYWFFYGYQSTCDGVSGAHNGDWERVMVTLSEDQSSLAAVTYYMHGEHYTRLAARAGFEVEEGTHPVVFVGKASHASFHEQGGSSNTCLPMEEFRNNGNGTHMDTWNNLVDLNGNAEPWIAADRTGGFETWGDDGVRTHPTQNGPSCDLAAATYDTLVPVWYKSQCKFGDEDSGTFCVRQCEPGYDEFPLTCTECSGFWPWEWDCDTYSRDLYNYGWTIPTNDVGLLGPEY